MNGENDKKMSKKEAKMEYIIKNASAFKILGGEIITVLKSRLDKSMSHSYGMRWEITPEYPRHECECAQCKKNLLNAMGSILPLSLVTLRRFVKMEELKEMIQGAESSIYNIQNKIESFQNRMKKYCGKSAITKVKNVIKGMKASMYGYRGKIAAAQRAIAAEYGKIIRETSNTPIYGAILSAEYAEWMNTMADSYKWNVGNAIMPPLNSEKFVTARYNTDSIVRKEKRVFLYGLPFDQFTREEMADEADGMLSAKKARKESRKKAWEIRKKFNMKELRAPFAIPTGNDTFESIKDALLTLATGNDEDFAEGRRDSAYVFFVTVASGIGNVGRTRAGRYYHQDGGHKCWHPIGDCDKCRDSVNVVAELTA